MEFIEAKIDPNSTQKTLSKRLRRGPKVEGKTRLKSSKIANRTNPAAAHLARPCQVAWSGQPARPGRATLLAAGAGWSFGAWSCALLSARVLPRFPLFLFLMLGASSIL